MRILQHVLTLKANSFEERADLVIELVTFGRLAMHDEWLAHGITNRSTRIEAGKRILEDDLHLLAMLTHVARLQMRDIGAVEQDLVAITFVSLLKLKKNSHGYFNKSEFDGPNSELGNGIGKKTETH